MDNIILQKTWVQGCPVIVDNLLGTAFTGEAQAHTFVVSGVDAAQEPVTITGTITGKFLAANNVTVPLTGSLVNGAASVTLTDECYDVPGRYILSIYATNGETTQCLYCAVGNVFRTDSQTIAYPSTDLPNITTLMAQLEEILDGWPADYSQLQNDVSSLKSAYNEYTGRLGLTWEQGSITSSGESSSPNLIRSSVTHVENGDVIHYVVPEGYSSRFFRKNTETSYTNLGDFSEEGTYIVTEDMDLRFRMNHTSGTAVDPSSGESFVAYIFKKGSSYYPISALNNKQNAICDTINDMGLSFIPSWEQGRITTSGAPVSIYAIRTADFLEVAPNETVFVDFDTSNYTSFAWAFTNASMTEGTRGYKELSDGSMSYTNGSGSVRYLKFVLSLNDTTASLDPANGYSLYSIRKSFGSVTHDMPVTPQMYGAVGDGIADDTVAFQAAINSGKCVYVPTANNEIYKITGSLDVPNSCKRIFGDAVPNGTLTKGVIIFDLSNSENPADIPLFKFTYAAQAISISGLSIKSINAGNTAAGICIDASKFVSGTTVMADKDITVDDVNINGFAIAIAMTGRGCEVRNSCFSQCINTAVFNWIGEYQDGNTAHPKEYNQRRIIFNNCVFHSNRSTAIVIESGHAYGMMIVGCTMDTGRGGLVSANDEGWNWCISNNVIQGHANTAIILKNGIKNSIINSNVFSRDSDFWTSTDPIYSMPENDIMVYGVTGCAVNNNVFNGTASSAIAINGYRTSLTWEQGNLTATGGESGSNNLIRTNNYVAVEHGQTINVVFDHNNYEARAIVFDADNIDANKANYLFDSSIKSYTNNSGSTRYLRFRLGRLPTAEITPDVGNEEFYMITQASNGISIMGNMFNNVVGKPVDVLYSATNISIVGNVDAQGREI